MYLQTARSRQQPASVQRAASSSAAETAPPCKGSTCPSSRKAKRLAEVTPPAPNERLPHAARESEAFPARWFALLHARAVFSVTAARLETSPSLPPVFLPFYVSHRPTPLAAPVFPVSWSGAPALLSPENCLSTASGFSCRWSIVLVSSHSAALPGRHLVSIHATPALMMYVCLASEQSPGVPPTYRMLVALRLSLLRSVLRSLPSFIFPLHSSPFSTPPICCCATFAVNPSSSSTYLDRSSNPTSPTSPPPAHMCHRLSTFTPL